MPRGRHHAQRKGSVQVNSAPIVRIPGLRAVKRQESSIRWLGKEHRTLARVQGFNTELPGDMPGTYCPSWSPTIVLPGGDPTAKFLRSGMVPPR